MATFNGVCAVTRQSSRMQGHAALLLQQVQQTGAISTWLNVIFCWKVPENCKTPPTSAPLKILHFHAAVCFDHSCALLPLKSSQQTRVLIVRKTSANKSWMQSTDQPELWPYSTHLGVWDCPDAMRSPPEWESSLCSSNSGPVGPAGRSAKRKSLGDLICF